MIAYVSQLNYDLNVYSFAKSNALKHFYALLSSELLGIFHMESFKGMYKVWSGNSIHHFYLVSLLKLQNLKKGGVKEIN